jgi:DNA repair protein RecN (Recombination protein N)
MLKTLRIKNFAIIENLSVDFHSGLNILTGETGAGKSILINAFNLILGDRADTDYIRTGEDSAVVEGLLVVEDPDTLKMIEELGIVVEQGEILIKRQLSRTGKSRCLLNDSQITVASLAKIGNRLVDIHGQHDHQALLNSDTHVDLLDLYGKCMADRHNFATNFNDYQALTRKLADLKTREQDRLQREDLLNFQANEIDDIAPSVEEEESLKTEKNKLQHAEKLHQTLDTAKNLLAEDEGSVQERLGKASRELESLTGIDASLEKQLNRVNTAFYEIEEAVGELDHYLAEIRFDPGRMEEIEDRLAEINGMKRKYGGDISAVLDHRQKITDELESLAGNQEQMDELVAVIEKNQQALAKLAVALAQKREKAALEMKKNVEKELKSLSMAQVQFGVKFDYPPSPKGFVKFRNVTVALSATGIGVIEFMFSPNPGEDLRPMAKIASGGELSRVMLALKSMLHKQDPIPVMVFDEVDTGIGGSVAEKVGVKLRKVAADKQVFCITHLPQIAGMASAHFRVQKDVRGKRTCTTIVELDYDQRVEEIARMSGGEKITEATLEHAREMIQATGGPRPQKI